MHLGQVADPSIGYYPQGPPITFRPDPTLPTFSASGGTKVDPATALLLIDELGPAAAEIAPLPPPPVFDPPPTAAPIGNVAIVGGAALLIVGALWYFNR